MQINTFVKNFLNLGQICCELFWVFSISVITIFAANRRSVNGQQCSSSSVVAWRSQLIVLCFVTVTSRLQSAVGTALCSDGWWLIRNIFTKYFFFFLLLPNMAIFSSFFPIVEFSSCIVMLWTAKHGQHLEHWIATTNH